ncbi:MAG: flagellar biosynthetic protein FliO [Gammaproteobacteria bacterium]|nr:flagellar biosynthetic protein FliO [Gammaproteobacteria bacterium]
MNMRLQCAWILLTGFLPRLSSAAATDEKGTLHAASPLAAGALTETALGLIAIIALIFALSWLFRRFGKQAFTGKGVVTVVGGVSLGPRERAVLLQVGGTRLLVGVAPGQVRTLHVLEQDSGEAMAEDQFEGQLRREMGGAS